MTVCTLSGKHFEPRGKQVPYTSQKGYDVLGILTFLIELKGVALHTNAEFREKLVSDAFVKYIDPVFTIWSLFLLAWARIHQKLWEFHHISFQ